MSCSAQTRSPSPRAVAEAHVAQLDLAAQASEVDGVRRVDEVGLLVEQLEDLVERGHARLVGRVELRELLDRVEEEVQRGDEADDDADLDVAVDRLQAAVQEDRDRRQRAEQLDGREVRRVEVDGRHVHVAVALVELVEAPDVARLLAERAHDADPRQRLLQVGRDRPDRRPRLRVRVRRRDPEGERREAHHGEDEERQQRQLDVQPEQDRHRADERQGALEQRHDAVGDERVQRLHVVGHARDELARLAALVEADRLGLQVGEDPQPQVLQRALADPADEVGLRVRRAPVHERADDEREHDEVKRADVAGADAVVDRELDERRRRERRRGRRDERDEHEDDPRAVGRQQRHEPAQLAPAAAGLAQAAAQLGRRQRRVAVGDWSATRRAARRPACACSQARHLGLERLAREEDLVGQALLDDLAVERRALDAARRACRGRRGGRRRAPRSRRRARSSTAGGR